MKITNNSVKIIGVNGLIVLPGQEVEVSKEVVANSAVKALVDMGFLIAKGGEETKDTAKSPKSKSGKAVAEPDEEVKG